MRTLIAGILAILTLAVLLPSCDNTESYADKVKKERKNIKKFIADNNIELLDKYPEDGKFKENEFLFDDGVYIQVVDTGNGNRASNKGTLTRVNVKCAKARELPSTAEFGSGNHPISFVYGIPTTYQEMSSSDQDGYILKSPALAVPLKYVGEEGIVKLIIPFSQGSYYQKNSSYTAFYIGHVEYVNFP